MSPRDAESAGIFRIVTRASGEAVAGRVGKERGPMGTRDAESDKHFRQVARASGEAVEGRAEVAL